MDLKLKKYLLKISYYLLMTKFSKKKKNKIFAATIGLGFGMHHVNVFKKK